MGHKYRCSNEDLTNAAKVINLLAYDASDSSSTGWIALGAKQDLYRLKWIVEDALKRCPDFGDTEKEWLKEQEQKQIIKILKDEV